MSTALPNAVSEQQLLERYRRDGDAAARDELMRRMTPLVRRVATRYRARGHEDDLMQVAWLGLVKAIDRYDPSHGSALISYAIPTMSGEVRRYLRDHSWAIHVPRPLQERVLAVTKAVESLASRQGRSPTAQQVADELELELEEVLEALQAGSAYATTPLDAPASHVEDGERTLAEAIGSDDARLQLAEDAVALGSLRDDLDGRERRVLYLRFVKDMTQSEIAREIGCSQMQISRILRRVLDRLSEKATRVPALA